MSEMDFEEKVEAFWEDCDTWVSERCAEAAGPGEEAVSEIADAVDQRISTLLEQGVQCYGEAFSPGLLSDAHHLLFELELKKHGCDNEQQIHRYKENGMLGISVMEGRVNPDNAQLIMKLNQAHAEKKGGKDDEPCEDCICGKKELSSQ
jgi:hypothetical protein